MTKSKTNAGVAAFLARLDQASPAEASAPPATTRSLASARPNSKPGPDKKHIGGYFDPEFVELFTVLKVRLKMDNSELIKRAVEALNADIEASRAFGGRV